MKEIIALVNQKGGVGKTTSVINLSAILTTLGKKVLIIDIDPQGNATTGLGIDRKSLKNCIYDLLINEVPIEEVIIKTNIKNLSLIPSTLNLAGAEVELVPLFEREKRLKMKLLGIDEDYDYIFIDCPPSLGLLTINSLVYANSIIIPIQCEFYAMDALGQLLNTIEKVRMSLNPTLKIKGILLTMYDLRTNLSYQVAEEVKKHFGDKVFKAIIPRSVRLSEAPSYGKPVIMYDVRSSGAKAYKSLAEEILAERRTRETEGLKELLEALF